MSYFLLVYPHEALCSNCDYHTMSYIENKSDGRVVKVQIWGCSKLKIDVDPSTLERCNMKSVQTKKEFALSKNL